MSMPSTAVGSPEETPIVPLASRENSGPVTSHPPPIPWDDQSTLDLPYDNPYYTRAINNVLWLPRNPCGTLDLDDTVDLKVAISVDPTAGQIGTWIGVTGKARSPSDIYEAAFDSSRLSPRLRASSMLSASSMNASAPVDHDEAVSLTSEPEEVDGTEDIDLPEILAKRAEQKDNIEHVARPRRPSTIHRHTSEKTSSLRSRRRPSSSRSPSMTMSHSVSDMRARSQAQKQNSIMSVLNNQPVSQPDPAARPDAHAQAELVMAHPTPSHMSEAAPTLKRAPNISANRAIYHEVLAEEKQALEQRLEEEQAEVDKNQSKSWLTRWMFTKA
jgi:hypothetical protein